MREGKKMGKRYQLIVVWNDCSCKSELVDNFPACLAAAAIYAEDPSCCIIHIVDNWKQKMVLDWYEDSIDI
jgi:hypothetical protein